MMGNEPTSGHDNAETGSANPVGNDAETARKVTRGRYVVKPVAKGATDKKKPRPPAKSTAGDRGAKKTGARSGQKRVPTKKRLPDDPDHQWLKQELRAAETVAQVLGRQGQFDNKIRALKLRHEVGKPLYEYAERMEAFLKQLKLHPWTSQLRDLRQDDPVIRKLKL